MEDEGLLSLGEVALLIKVRGVSDHPPATAYAMNVVEVVTPAQDAL